MEELEQFGWSCHSLMVGLEQFGFHIQKEGMVELEQSGFHNLMVGLEQSGSRILMGEMEELEQFGWSCRSLMVELELFDFRSPMEVMVGLGRFGSHSQKESMEE
jgi:hypothetical protein